MSKSLEHDLETLHQLPAPDPAFAARLRNDLRLRVEQLENPARENPSMSFWGLFRRTWRFAAVTAFLLIVALFTFVGPQRVWASIQQFFRYVPGVGFLDLENARVLPAPVAVEREGITLIITQVIATSDRTTLRFEIQGLPPIDQGRSETGDLSEDFQAQLRLADGTTLASQGMGLGLGSGQVDFPPLPAETSQITFELNHLPLTPPDMFPENWVIPLSLRPIDGELDMALFPEPYFPENATDTHFGITARVLQVAQAPEGTALQLEIAADDGPPWSTYVRDLNLSDDIGHSYSQSYEANASSVQTMIVSVEEVQEESQASNDEAHLQTYVFYPTSLMARQMTLEIPEIGRSLSLEGSFSIDVGENPQVGDSWVLNMPIEIAGLQGTILSARITKEIYEEEESIVHLNHLEFLIQFEPDEEGRTISSLYFENPGGYFDRGGGSETPNSPDEPAKVYLSMDATRPFPSGQLTFQVVNANIIYPGPWLLTWPVPRGGDDPNQSTRPVILHPDAQATHNDITVSLTETVQTDRLLALAFEAENLPVGIKYLNLASWGTNWFNQSQVTLSDNLGNTTSRYYWKISWAPYDEKSFPQTHINFAPPDPLATRMTLNIPAVELFVPVKTSFDITVPPDKTLIREEIDELSDIPPEGAWEVDIPVEIAGFQIHFTHAWLEDINNPVSLVLFAKDVTAQVGNFHLTGLQMETVQMPNGQIWKPLPYPAISGFAGQTPGGTYYTMLTINAFDPQQTTPLAGIYHVGLNGIIATVPGPWKLSWDLLGP